MVPIRFSSATSRMVTAGTKKRKSTGANEKKGRRVAYPTSEILNSPGNTQSINEVANNHTDTITPPIAELKKRLISFLIKYFICLNIIKALNLRLDFNEANIHIIVSHSDSMNKKMKIRIIIGSILIILSIIAGSYSYLQLTNRELGADIDLFSFVPENSVAILETNNVSELMENIEQASFIQRYDSLELSYILTFLKSNVDLLKANIAHGLSSQMNQILISFHYPGTPKDQVLYGKLAAADGILFENLIKENSAAAYPARYFEYRGEKIQIYPLDNDNFLACYFKPGFYAVSYQKKLIEEVIDAHLYKKSILNDSIFTQFLKDEKSYSSTSLYIKAQNIPLGKDIKENKNTFHLSRWTAFKINMKDDALYLSGECIDTDTCVSFENMLKYQQPIDIYPSKYLPATTSFFYQMSISDFEKTFNHTRKNNMLVNRTSLTIKNDSLIHYFLKHNAGDELRFIIFNDDITTDTTRKVMSIQMKDALAAESELNTYVNKKNRKSTWIKGKSYPVFTLPDNSIFAQFSSNPTYSLNTYGCFYNGDLLVSPNELCIYSYIRQVESANSMEGNILFEKCVSSLSSESNYLSVIDMERAVLYPEIYGQLMPNFFIRHQNFFKHFILTIQFTCVNQNIYPYIVLMHKIEGDQQNSSIPSNAK